MSDFTDTYESVEARLHDYGAVLQAHLDGTGDDNDARGLLLVADHNVVEMPRRKPTVAILSVAAAVVAALALLVPSLVASDPSEPIMVTGGDVASSPEKGDSADADAPDVADQSPTNKGDGASLVEGEDGHVVDGHDDDDKGGDDADWSSFVVGMGGTKDQPGDSQSELADGAVDDQSTGSSAATAGAEEDNSTDGDTKDGDTTDGEAKDGDTEPDDTKDDTKPDDTKDGDGSDSGDTGKTDDGEQPKAGNDCPAGKEKSGDTCVVIGSSPTQGEGCPDGAVVFGDQCYEVVPPTCGDLEVAPNGDCLKLVGAAGAQGGCPQNYSLEGDTCVKLLAAPLNCTQGTPSGDACLIKQSPTGGDSGCESGLSQFGDGCYELTSPSSDCGELATLADGNCRLPVDGEQSTECPAGLQPWDTICYRYEDPPTYDCAGGESDGAGWCRTTEAATPGPDVCDDGVLQDDQGCYVLYDIHEDGTCGGLPEFEGKCRQEKPSYQTWTCADGKTVYESTCEVWVEAVSVSCAAGEPVENNTKCKTIADPITTDGCPSYALQDSSGCYKSKPAQTNCGELAVAPDGQHCKRWVHAAGSAATCQAGFDLVGDYCKKYVDGTPGTCSGAELVTIGGTAKCRYTTAPANATTGCAANAVERSGNCYKVVAPSCGDLDVDPFGTGCKKLIAD